MRLFLKDSGADIDIFRTGKEFVDYITEEHKKIDLIFMDFLIPLINGIECVRVFRKGKQEHTCNNDYCIFV